MGLDDCVRDNIGEALHIKHVVKDSALDDTVVVGEDGLDVVQHVLAVFNDEKHTFVLRTPVANQRTGKYAMLRNTEDAIPYRLSSPLAQHVINSALSLSLSENAEIIFDQQALPMNANLPDYLNGSEGYLVLASLGVSALSDEQYLLFNAFQNDGSPLSQEDCEKLFLNGGLEVQSDNIADDIRQRLQGDVAQHSTAKLKEIDTRNLKFFQQEETRIYQWEHDVIDGIEDEITTLKKNILVAERDARNATELEQRMVKATETSNLFVIKFKVK